MSEMNRRRARAIAVSRAWKQVLRPAGAAWVGCLAALAAWAIGGRRALRAWCYRVVFRADGVVLRRAAEHVLHDLRDYSFGTTSAFDRDPVIMARRQGRRDVWLRISNYLNLDETVVRELMEIDDGI